MMRRALFIGEVRAVTRWRTGNKRTIGLFIIFVVAAVWFGSPSLAQASSLRTTVTAALTDLFQGAVEVGDTQLRGLSRVIVQDVKVFDPRTRPN